MGSSRIPPLWKCRGLRVGKPRLDALEPKRRREQQDIEKLGDLDRDHPWHGEVLEAGARVDNVQLLAGLEIGRQSVRIADHVDVLTGVVVESDVLGLGEHLAPGRGSGHLAAPDL
jgi:hypothetical protein